MKPLKITSPEALDTAVAAVVRTKIRHTALTAEMEAEVAAIQKRYAARLATLAEDIATDEADILAHCTAHRSALFTDKKSRETATAIFGFEWTPYRVETASRKIKIKDVLARLKRLAWGKLYIRTPEDQLDKVTLLTDREKLTPEQLAEAAIQFERDEQFFIRPKSESAEDSATPAN